MLWFPEWATYIFPGWFINVATIIHSDEALLAVGFIFTVHFFNTHFRPEKFPMDMAMFTGRVDVEEMLAVWRELRANRPVTPAAGEGTAGKGTAGDDVQDPPDAALTGQRIPDRRRWWRRR